MHAVYLSVTYILSPLRSVLSNACQHTDFCQLLLVSLSFSSVIFEERGEKRKVKKKKVTDLSRRKLILNSLNGCSVKLTQV